MYGPLTDCIYCGSSIDPCATGEHTCTVEHVLSQSLGGALTIPAHKRCNGKANRLIDDKLAALPSIGRIRGRLGVRCSSGPYVHREAWNSPQGPRAFICWSTDGLSAKLIPREIELEGGDTEVFLEPDSPLSRDYEERHRERVERDGCYLGDPRPGGGELVGKEVAILFREPRWSLPKYLWCAAAAKYALGAIADGLSAGLLTPSTLELPLLAGLRMMAFETSLATSLWDHSTFPFEPGPVDPTTSLAALARHEHLLALRGGEHPGQAPSLQIVVFGSWSYRLPLPGLRLAEDRAWLFDSVGRRVRRFGWAELEARLRARALPGTEALQLAGITYSAGDIGGLCRCPSGRLEAAPEHHDLSRCG